jgi:hypothetical protein
VGGESTVAASVWAVGIHWTECGAFTIANAATPTANLTLNQRRRARGDDCGGGDGGGCDSGRDSVTLVSAEGAKAQFVGSV